MPGKQQLEAETQPDQRLISLDTLRGFDMFWLMGGTGLVNKAAELSNWGWLKWLAGQTHHPEWHGFLLYDLIFPLFLFIAGTALPFSIAKREERGDSRWQLHRHALVRGLLLVLLGLVYNGMLKWDWANLRYPSVLGRIGLASMFAAFIVLNTKVRGQILWAAGLLLGYWAALKFIPVPHYGAGDLAPGHTLTDFIDRQLLPGRLLHPGVRDPEGLLSTLPAIATALAGALAGQLLKSSRFGGHVKFLILGVAGAACLGLGQLWNLDFPINKNLWSSSFVLHCAGLSLLLLAPCYLVVDVWRWRAWTFFFVVIGCNSIFIYLARIMIDFSFTTHFLFDGMLLRAGASQRLLWYVAYIFVQWMLLFIMYRKQIFLRV